jgi:hypothetical protein
MQSKEPPQTPRIFIRENQSDPFMPPMVIEINLQDLAEVRRTIWIECISTQFF